MDNLPKDPPDSGNNNSTSDPVSEAHSETASHQHRDPHGRFIPEHQEGSIPPAPNSPNTPTIPNPTNPSTLPAPQVIHNTSTGGGSGGGNKSSDDPLFEAKINNPFSKFFNWIKKLIKNEGINIKIKPLTAIGIALAISGSSGVLGGIIGYAFPHSSPILHRSVIYQGNLQRTPSGFILTLPNSDLYTLRPKSNTSINFKSLPSGPALVKGNLTPENFVIEVSEIIPLNASSSTSPY